MASESKGASADAADAPDPAEVKAALERAAALPNEIAQLRFRASCGDAGADGALLELVRARAMSPFYEALCAERGAAPDAALLAAMRAANAVELAALDAKAADAKEQHGEVELADAIIAKARTAATAAAAAPLRWGAPRDILHVLRLHLCVFACVRVCVCGGGGRLCTGRVLPAHRGQGRGSRDARHAGSEAHVHGPEGGPVDDSRTDRPLS